MLGWRVKLFYGSVLLCLHIIQPAIVKELVMRIFGLILISLLLVNCGATRAIYGVPQDKWEQMSEPERQAAIERYEQQQAIYAETRNQAEKARQEAEEFAKKCHETNDAGDTSGECEVITRRRFGL